jgi:hypothetical protein
MAQWIRRLPTEQEMLPVWTVVLFFFIRITAKRQNNSANQREIEILSPPYQDKVRWSVPRSIIPAGAGATNNKYAATSSHPVKGIVMRARLFLS